MENSKKDILCGMSQLLDVLLKNAKDLNLLSEQVISEEELSLLQVKQDELIRELEKLEADYKIRLLDQEKLKGKQLRKEIKKKMSEFQKLNTAFMRNLTEIHGLIQFEHNDG